MANFFHKYPYENFHELNLDWILEQIKEFGATLDSYKDVAEKLEEALKQLPDYESRITVLESLTDGLDAKLLAINNSIDGLISEDTSLQNQIDALKREFDLFDANFDAVYKYIDSQIAVVNSDVDAKLDAFRYSISYDLIQLQKEVDSLRKIIEQLDTSVLNPWHPELGRVSQDRNQKLIYNDLADECLTAEEYCSLGLSASDYASYDLTAIKYAEFGKKKLHFYWVYAPVEGFRQEISNVLTNIINNVFNTITADVYASLDMTADDYLALDLTASGYQKYNI